MNTHGQNSKATLLHQQNQNESQNQTTQELKFPLSTTSAQVSTIDQSDYHNYKPQSKMKIQNTQANQIQIPQLYYQNQTQKNQTVNERYKLQSASGVRNSKIQDNFRTQKKEQQNLDLQRKPETERRASQLRKTAQFGNILQQNIDSNREKKSLNSSLKIAQNFFQTKQDFSSQRNPNQSYRKLTIPKTSHSKQRYQIQRNYKVDYSTISEPYRSPGDYEIPQLIGNDQISLSTLKTPPGFSFPKQQRIKIDTNKSMLGRRQSKDFKRFNNESILTTISITHQSPCAGDYNFDSLEFKQKQPRCAIGKSDRFEVDLLITNSSLIDSRGGVIGSQTRFKNEYKPFPGPGEYETHIYKSLSKGELSILAMSDCFKNNYKQSGQAISKMISPRQTLQPFSASRDTLNHSTREQSNKAFAREYAKDFVNKAGPGPGCYNSQQNQTVIEKKNNYSIPKSNRQIQLREFSKEKKVPMSYSDIKNHINVLLNQSYQSGVKIPQSNARFDPRKSKIN
eukprot:403375076